MTAPLSEMNPSALTERELKAIPAEKPLVTAKVRQLIANGRHNAFPTIARWNGAFYIAYREGDAHAGPGLIVILRSADGQQWREVQRIQKMADDRDPQLVINGDRLWLFVVGAQDGGHCTYVYTAGADGTFQCQGKTNLDGMILWRPIAHKGRFYCAPYTGSDHRTLRLATSEDGLNWTQIVSMGSAPGQWSETAIHIDAKERLTAFLRLKYKAGQTDTCHAPIWESDPPYTTWNKRTTLTFRIEGPGVSDFQGRTYLFTRGFNSIGGANAMNIHRYDSVAGQTSLYCSIPTMRDCSYGQAVEMAPSGGMLMVFYSTAPDGVNLYLADIPLL